MLSNFSDAALEHAVRELAKKSGGVNSPVNWIASVARSFDAKASIPKTGRWKAYNNPYAAKIVEGKFNPNHSPSSAAPKIDPEQRKAFLESEIPKIEALIAAAESGVFMHGGAAYGRKVLQNIHFELKELAASTEAVDEDYEAHLEEISADKSNPAGYKQLVAKYDYNRVAR